MTTHASSVAHGLRDRCASPLRVASVPSGHVYVRHLSPESGPGPVRLPDPDPAEPAVPAGATWWPPVMLRPEWAATAEFDLFHLHFGFGASRSCSPSTTCGPPITRPAMPMTPSSTSLSRRRTPW